MTGRGERWLAIHPGLPGRTWMVEGVGPAEPDDGLPAHPETIRAERVVVGGQPYAVFPLDGRVLAERVAPTPDAERAALRRAARALVEAGPSQLAPERLVWDGRALRILAGGGIWGRLDDPGLIERARATFEAWVERLGEPWPDPVPLGERRPRVAAVSSAGTERALNEDAVVWAGRGDALLVAVADGLGGWGVGPEAAVAVAGSFLAWFEEAPEMGANELFRRSVAHANRALEGKGGDASALAVRLEGGIAEVAHVGNCRLYTWVKGGLTRVTEEHTIGWHLARQGKPAPQAHHRNILVRSFGATSEAPEYDRHTLALRPRDVLLLCTDGLYEAVDDATIAALLRRAGTPRQAAALLHGAAVDAGARDNVTVVVIDV